MTIRPVEPSEIEALHALRLRALQDWPAAYASTYEETSILTPEEVRARFSKTEENFVMGAYDDAGNLVGMAGFKREDRIKTRHRSGVWGMYVAPEARRHGYASAMLQAIIAHAKTLPGLEQITLGVITVCQPAHRLYLANGFEENGLERACLRQGDEYHDNQQMIYWLKQPLGE